MKLYWKVDPAPTGRFRSFEKRGWPTAYYDKDEDKIAAALYCDAEYVPSIVKSGELFNIQVRIADYSIGGGGWEWRTMKTRCKSLDEAKKFVFYVLTGPRKLWAYKYEEETK